MKYLIYVGVIVLLLALEAGVFTQFAIRGAIPDLIFLMVIYFATKHEDLDSYGIALLGGLFTDLYSGLPIGTMTLGYLIVAGLIHVVFHSVTIHEVRWKQIPFVVSAAVVLLYGWMVGYTWLLVQIHLTGEVLVAADVRTRILPSLVYNFILLYPAMTLFTFLDDFIISIQKRSRSVI